MPRYQRCSTCGEAMVWLPSSGLGEPRPFRIDPTGDYVYDASGRGVRHVRPDEQPGGPRWREHWPCNGEPVARAAPHGNGRLDVTLVPHTHWDREWYAPFQTYRLRLVRVVDALLDLLERDPTYRHFLLDGQTAALDDYLEVRPENEPRLRALGAAGRLASGPWTTLPDEFMVSGETLVRNLQSGMARARDLLGSSMQVGYSPDSFGHVAQMPQILALAGIGHALVWRGVPLCIDTTAFRWEAPDGSAVRAEYLPHGYSQGWSIPDSAEELLARIADYDLATAGQRIGALLVMAGGDHIAPHEQWGRAVSDADTAQDRYHVHVGSLEDYLAAEPADGLPVWRGELRSSGRHSVIMGVTSNRMDAKLACAAAERAVERGAEPLSALLLPADDYPHRLLGLAWRRLVLNAAHDSACACSHDDVVTEVLDRYHQARQIGTGLAQEAVEVLAARLAAPAGSIVVVNPAGHALTGVVTVPAVGAGPWHVVDATGAALPTQAEPVHLEPLTEQRMTLADLPLLRDVADSGRLAEWPIARAEVDDSADVVEVTLAAAAADGPTADLGPLWRRLEAAADVSPHRALHLRVLPAPAWRLHAAVREPVAAFGWSTCSVAAGAGPTGPVYVEGHLMGNGLLDVEVDIADGTWSVRTADGVSVEGLGRYVDQGDGGDTYNWSPPLEDRVVDAPESVTLDRPTSGPVVGRLRLVARYLWPADANGDAWSCTARSETTVPVDVETVLELRAGEPFLRVTTAWDNRVRDHRLRVHLPLPARVRGSAAESAYAVVERGLTHEGNPYEAALPTYPARRFVDCSDGEVGLAVVHDGVVEYEVVAEGSELALTLVRSVGYLSRGDMLLRPGPAGPYVPIPGGQVPGRNERRWAVLPHRGDWRAADLYAVADRVLVEPLVAAASGGGTAAAVGAPLGVEGAEVCAVLRDDAGRLVVRLLRTDSAEGLASVALDGTPATGELVDLNGAARAPFTGVLAMRPWQIATLRLHNPPPILPPAHPA